MKHLTKGQQAWVLVPVKLQKHLPFSNIVAVELNNGELQYVKPEQVHEVKPESNEVLAKRIAELDREIGILRLEVLNSTNLDELKKKVLKND